MDDEETDHCFGIVVVYTCNKFGRLGFKKLACGDYLFSSMRELCESLQYHCERKE